MSSGPGSRNIPNASVALFTHLSDNCLSPRHLIRNGFPENSTLRQVSRYLDTSNGLHRPKKSSEDSGQVLCRLICTGRQLIQLYFHNLLGMLVKEATDLLQLCCHSSQVPLDREC